MEILQDLLTFLMNLIEQFGYLGLFFVVSIEYACFPLPSEVILPFIGYLASKEIYSLFISLLVSILAGLIGSLICYYIGYYGGTPIIHKVEKIFPSSTKSFKAIERITLKYGKPTVFITRLVPLTRTYISLIVGCTRMPLKVFLPYSLLGISIWNTILITLGYYVGENTEIITQIMSNYSKIAIILFVLLIAGYYLYKRYKQQKKI